jgi:predicted RNase H-like HicB family nuclease
VINDDVGLKVILKPSEDGGFTVLAPSLPGCAEGETAEEALQNMQEAIELYLEP